MKKILTTSILALASLAFIVPAANAQLSYNDGDLVIAFKGASSTYLADLGSAYLFQQPTLNDGTVHILSINTTDLNSVSATKWGIMGSDPFGPNASVWASQQHGQPTLQNANSSSLATPGFDIQSMGTAFSQGTQATLPNTSIQANGATNSYSSYIASPSGIAFEYFPATFQGNISAGTGSGLLDLYRLNATDMGGTVGPATLVGAFQVQNGVLEFSSNPNAFAPVPEPATFAFGFAMLGACAMGRFRTRRQADVDIVA
jgi:hypothetical protein